MKQTTNLKLNKPDYEDIADVAKLNENSDILDREVNDRLSTTKGGTVEKDLTVSGGLTVNGTTTINGALKANALDKKADKVHTHSLTDNKITGTLPISKGGTGGATATDARTNLGLGSAATYSAGGSITTGNNSLVTGDTVAAFFNAQKIQKKTHIVVASYNTKNPFKDNADFVCEKGKVKTTIRKALQAISEGGRIEFLDGTYQLEYEEGSIVVDKKSVTIEGSGFTTVIKQPADMYAEEARPVFEICADNVTIKNMMICDENLSSPVSMIIQKAQGAIYEGVFFIFKATGEEYQTNCIEGEGNCYFTRIQNCRVYQYTKDSKNCMFNFSKCTNFSGVISGNISSGFGDISIAFKDKIAKNNTAVYGHKAVKIYPKDT